VSTQTPRPQTSAQASQHLQNLQELGPNTLPQSRTVPPWQMVLGAVNDPLVLVPLAAVVPTSVARNVTDTMVIALVIAVNTTLAVPQEIGADRAESGRVAVQHRRVRDTPWTHITSWPTASPAITKGSTCRTWPCPVWPGPG
jgi:magnesium-transporting ATPase (P-type)